MESIIQDFEGKGSSIDVKCVVLDQSLSTDCSSGTTTLDVVYQLTSSDTGVGDSLLEVANSDTAQAAAAATIEMTVSPEPAVVITFGTDSPTSSSAPSLTPSASQVPSTSQVPTSPTSSPTSVTAKPVLPPFFGYTFIGEGQCSDSYPISERTYSYLEFSSSLPDECPGHCAIFRESIQLRGFEFDASNASQSYCKCLFDKDPDLTEYGVVSSDIITGGATGSISDFVITPNVECYKRAPLDPPVDVVEYEYVGFGDCLDSSGRKYDYINVTDIVNTATNPYFETCGSECKDRQSLRGFWVEEDTFCLCLFDDETDPPINGTGPIANSDYTMGQCYLDIPPPTNTPTTPPTTAPPVRHFLYSYYF